MKITEQSFNRLAKLIMIHDGLPYGEALDKLYNLNLRLVIDKEIESSPALQAALLTAINTGKRAFLGGITLISHSPDIPLLLPFPGCSDLMSAAKRLADNKMMEQGGADFTISFGHQSIQEDNSVSVYCDGWRFQILPSHETSSFESGPDFALGGVAAASLAVCLGFLHATNIKKECTDRKTALSLWNPTMDIDYKESHGPQISLLPSAAWLLGLGHLGQAYLWNFGFLPYAGVKKPTFYLQDFDSIEESNYFAGLATEPIDNGKTKARKCAEWIEKYGADTRIIERAFDENTHRTGSEPFLALCGFDSVEARQILDHSRFDYIVECGVGSALEDFDSISFHTLKKNENSAAAIWKAAATPSSSQAPKLKLDLEEDCGILAQTLENKAISTSFVGGFAGALALAEVLKGLHNGKRIISCSIPLRNINNSSFDIGKEYTTELSRCFFSR